LEILSHKNSKKLLWEILKAGLLMFATYCMLDNTVSLRQPILIHLFDGRIKRWTRILEEKPTDEAEKETKLE